MKLRYKINQLAQKKLTGVSLCIAKK